MTLLIHETSDKFFHATANTTEGSVYLCHPNRPNVLCYNSSHRAHRGQGRIFDTFEEALSKYKSPEMKSIIQAAKEHFQIID